MYMTPFQCNVTNPSKRVIGKPVAPVRCDGNPPCPAQPKWGNTTKICPKVLNPMYWKNAQGNNIDNPGHCAPTYNSYYGFPDGAQHQIFVDSLMSPEGSAGDILNSGESLSSSQSSLYSLVSPSYATKLTLQKDGNVVLSDVNSGKVYWSTNTGGQGVAPYRLMLEWDGNLVLSDSESTTLWTSNTGNKGVGPYKLKLKDIVSLRIVDSNSSPIWSI